MAYTTIDKHNLHYKTHLFSGNGSSNAQTGIGFQPDIVWIKNRSAGDSHSFYDSVRGATKRLKSDTNDVESTQSNGLTAFGTDGFTVGDHGGVNGNGNSIVAWNWRAGGAAPTQTYKVVVVSDSGNKYRFRNSADTATFGASAVTLDLQEGGTYTFDVSDSTMNSHPFVIGTAANSSEYSTGVTYKLDGVTKTYSQYTSGFSAATSRQLIITVAASAPALYYWCSQHSGMGGAINTNATFGSSNFDGNIQSLVSANTTAGISIVRYTGDGSASATIGHGLGGKIDQIWQKDLTATDSWHIFSKDMTSGYNMFFNNDSVHLNPSDGVIDNFTTTTFGFNANGGNVNAVNENNIPCICYCFKSVTGFSSFGKYRGNNNSVNGPMVYTGFKPSFILVKKMDSSGYWVISDKLRNNRGDTVSNGSNRWLYPNVDHAEYDASSYPVDLLSMGFKFKHNGNYQNGNNDYIYAAFGQSVVGSNNVPATAR